MDTNDEIVNLTFSHPRDKEIKAKRDYCRLVYQGLGGLVDFSIVVHPIFPKM